MATTNASGSSWASVLRCSHRVAGRRMAMLSPDNPETEAPDVAASPGAALWPFLRAIRAHRRIVAAILAVTLGSSLLWLAQRSTEYSTSAEVLVAPLSASDRSFVGLPLIRAVGPDASAGVGSAVSILDTRAAAELLASRLDDGTTPEA